MKVYKVNVYKVCYDDLRIVPVDSIIVKKRLDTVKEILTGYSHIDIFPRDAVQPGYHGMELKTDFINYGRERRDGAHLFVFENSLVGKNNARPSDIDQYIDHYDESNWKKQYLEMKYLSKKEKKTVKQKVNHIMGTKQ